MMTERTPPFNAARSLLLRLLTNSGLSLAGQPSRPLPMSLEPASTAAGLWAVRRIPSLALEDSAADRALLFPAHDRFLLHDLNTVDRLRVAFGHSMILDDAPDNL